MTNIANPREAAAEPGCSELDGCSASLSNSSDELKGFEGAVTEDTAFRSHRTAVLSCRARQ